MRYERVNITLPRATLSLIDHVTNNSNRSAFLDRAVHFYIAETGRGNLKKHLRAGAETRYERDRGIATEWFPIESD
jgi:CopG family transcriptional regulator/antitoxin EndoAI